MAFAKRVLRTQAGRSLLLLLGMIVYFSTAIFLMDRTGIGCVFLYFLGIPCPGCGMTRALRCVLQLDLAGAFRFNPLVFAMPYVFAYIFFPMRGRVHKYILTVIGVVTVIHWVYRILCVAI